MEILDASYKGGTAAHFDVSYRFTNAMFESDDTDHGEFRQMVERDVQWFFRQLPLCPMLRGSLVLGPISRSNGRLDNLAGFLRKSAPCHGFKVLHGGGISQEAECSFHREIFVHDVSGLDEKTMADQIIAYITKHRERPCRQIHSD